MRKLALPAIALLALVAAALATNTKMARLTNLGVGADAIPDVFVQMSIGSADRCLVTDRAGVTTRRSEPELGASRWRCNWLAPQGDESVLTALAGKKPAYLYLPFDLVSDPGFPWLYEAVRDAERLPIPRQRWVRLYVQRVFRGLFLEVRLPGKRFAESHQLGRAELLSSLDDRLYCWNRKLRSSCALYSFLVAEGIFPQPASSPGLRLMSSMLDPDAPARSFILAELTSQKLWPWPLPFDLAAALDERDTFFSDRRLASWQEGLTPLAGDTIAGLDVEELALDAIRQALRETIHATCSLRSCSNRDEQLAAIEQSRSFQWLQSQISRGAHGWQD